MLVFAHRYRQTGQTKNPVRAGAVDKALLAVGKGFSDLGLNDPRKPFPGSRHNRPVLTAFLKRLSDQDIPASRTYPANITIVQGLSEALDTSHPELGELNSHVIDLIIVAFFWLLRPSEYLFPAEPEGRSQAFRLCDIYFTIGGAIFPALTAPLNDVNSIKRISYATLTFIDQKNAVRGEQVGHRSNHDSFFCPAKALGRIARRLRQQQADALTPIYRHYNSHASHRRWYNVKPTLVTNALRHSAKILQPITGIDPDLISARSLRPGGATALLCAGVDKDHIQLLGRWKSDAMFRYLRIQAATKNFAQLMFDNGAYTFAPGVYTPGVFNPDALPQQIPLNIAAAHQELYND
jgi:hypothetical protein